MAIKKCTVCKQELPATNEYFYNFRSSKDGLLYRCIECDKKNCQRWVENNRKKSREIKRKYAKANPEKHRGDPMKANLRRKRWTEKNPKQALDSARKHHLEKTYGITLDDYDDMLIAQKGQCAICGTENTGKFEHFCVDHNHETKKVRSLLCHHCNKLVGFVEKDLEYVEKAKTYVYRHTNTDYSI